MGVEMETPPDERWYNKIDRIGHSRYIIYGAPILASIISYLANPRKGFLVGLFFGLVWLFAGLTYLTLQIFDLLSPDGLKPKAQKDIRGAIGLSIFVGGFAAVGEIVHGETILSEWMVINFPVLLGISFIDTRFAFLSTVVVWCIAVVSISSSKK